jgi:hypothetical protein
MAVSRHRLNLAAGTIVLVAGAMLAIAKQVDVAVLATLPGSSWLQWAHRHAGYIYGALLVVALILKLVALRRTRSERLKTLRRILDALQAEVMKTPRTYNPENYRVTVFRRAAWSLRGWTQHRKKSSPQRVWPWSGWLVPVARSGDSQTSATRFCAPKTIPQGNGTGHGICGTAWLVGQADAAGLPLLSRDSSDAEITMYSNRTHICENEVRARLADGRSLARALYAERIAPKGQPNWGVVIYDSVDPVDIVDDLNRSGHTVGILSLAIAIEEFGR